MEILNTKTVNPEKIDVPKAVETITPNGKGKGEEKVLTSDDMSLKDKDKVYNESAKIISGQITIYSNSIQKDLEEYNCLRKNLGLPATNEIPPSVNQTMVKLEDSKKEFANVEEQLKQLENQRVATANEQANTNPESATENTDTEKEADNEKNKNTTEDEEEKKLSPEKSFEEIEEGTLSRLSEALKKKNELEERVNILKKSPEAEVVEAARRILEEQRKKLEGLKNVDNSTGSNIGSFSTGGNSTFNVNIENNISNENISNIENREGEKIDLEKEAENLIKKTNIEILKLEKEEIESSPEGLAVKMGELDLESKQVQAEIDIWSLGGMSQEVFSTSMQKINSLQETDQNIENKELFIKFRDASTEAKNYKDQNIAFYQSIDIKQTEIDNEERSAGDLSCPHESKILNFLNENIKEDEKDKNEEGLEVSENLTPNTDLEANINHETQTESQPDSIKLEKEIKNIISEQATQETKPRKI